MHKGCVANNVANAESDVANTMANKVSDIGMSEGADKEEAKTYRYRDPGKRRAYQKEYMRRRRRGLGIAYG